MIDWECKTPDRLTLDNMMHCLALVVGQDWLQNIFANVWSCYFTFKQDEAAFKRVTIESLATGQKLWDQIGRSIVNLRDLILRAYAKILNLPKAVASGISRWISSIGRAIDHGVHTVVVAIKVFYKVLAIGVISVLVLTLLGLAVRQLVNIYQNYQRQKQILIERELRAQRLKEETERRQRQYEEARRQQEQRAKENHRREQERRRQQQDEEARRQQEQRAKENHRREQERRRQQQDEEARRQQEQRAKENHRREQERRRQQEEQDHRRSSEDDDQRVYQRWDARCRKALASCDTMTEFPDPPCWPCSATYRCSENNVLKACRHSIKRLYEASGRDLRELLKKGKLKWHPDKFTRCPSSSREKIQAKATEMFKIIEMLNSEMK